MQVGQFKIQSGLFAPFKVLVLLIEWRQGWRDGGTEDDRYGWYSLNVRSNVRDLDPYRIHTSMHTDQYDFIDAT